MANKSFHADKIILGPMVRVGTLPMRLLALEHGADLVYTEEIIDFKLIKSRRLQNDILDTIDYVDEFGTVIFRTCPLERDKVVLQIGTNDPKRAALAAEKVQHDVAAIDINMGCPKSFSLKGGMGAALMTQPETVRKIIVSIKAAIPGKPVSCKVRVFDDLPSTLTLLRQIEEAGADAVAIHGRTKWERPQHANRNDYIRAAVKHLTIPVIANGDSSNIHCRDDFERFRTDTNASSVMVARAAMKNCSIFGQRMLDVDDIIKQYLKLAIKYDNNAINTKYCIQQMLGSLQEVGRGKRLMGTYDLRAMSQIYELDDYHDENQNEWVCRREKRKRNDSDVAENATDNDDIIQLPVIFDRTAFGSSDLATPKSLINKWIAKLDGEAIPPPKYETRQIEKQFHSVVRFAGHRYASPYLEKNKKTAEQTAALVAVLKLGLCNDRNVLENCLVGPDHQTVDHLECWHQGRRYLIKNETLMVVKDIKPAAQYHYLVIPKQHTENIKYLNNRHQSLVQDMYEMGTKWARDNIPEMDAQNLRLGFHRAPFNTVGHLHMHVLYPTNQMPIHQSWIFRPNSLWFMEADKALEYLRNKN